jgi:hypothetical protein
MATAQQRTAMPPSRRWRATSRPPLSAEVPEPPPSSKPVAEPDAAYKAVPKAEDWQPVHHPLPNTPRLPFHHPAPPLWSTRCHPARQCSLRDVFQGKHPYEVTLRPPPLRPVKEPAEALRHDLKVGSSMPSLDVPLLDLEPPGAGMPNFLHPQQPCAIFVHPHLLLRLSGPCLHRPSRPS